MARITTIANNIKLTHHKCGDLTNKTIAKTSKNSKKIEIIIQLLYTSFLLQLISFLICFIF